MFSDPFPKYFLLLFESHVPPEYRPQAEARLQPQTHQVCVFWSQTSQYSTKKYTKVPAVLINFQVHQPQ